MNWPSFGKTMTKALAWIAPLGLLVFYQNCGKGVSFEKIEADSTQSATGGEDPRTGPCPNGCREGKLDPAVNVERPPVKVVFVVDNSRSMTAAQTYLADGVHGLIRNLKGFNASFYVHTTTQSGVKQIVGTMPATCFWTETGEAKAAATCPNDKPIQYDWETRYPLSASITRSPYAIRDDMSEVLFQDVEYQLAQDVANVGIDGSGDERGVCSLNRTVYDRGANKIFAEGDTAAFVLISDEEDVSTPASCLSREVRSTQFQNRSASTGACVSGQPCDSYTYTVGFTSLPNNFSEIKFKCPNPNSVDQTCNPATEACDKVSYRVTMNSPQVKTAQKKYQCNDKAKLDDGVIVGWEAGTVKYEAMDAASCTVTGETDLATSECSALCGIRSVVQCKKACTVTTPTSNFDLTLTPPADMTTDFCTQTYQSKPNLKEYALSQPGNSNKVATGCTRTGTKRVPGAPLDKSISWNSTDACPATGTFDTNSKLTEMTAQCGGAGAPTNANFTCGSRPIPVSNCTFTDRTFTAQNLCDSTAVVIEGTSYNGVKDYCLKKAQALDSRVSSTNACWRDGGSRSIPGTGVVESSSALKKYSFPPDKLVSEVTSLQDSFVAGATKLFGEKGYFVSAIIRDEEADHQVPGCQPLTDYESYGTKYRSLVAATANGGSVTSICGSNYGDSLARVQQFVKESTERSYRVPDLLDGERIIEVWLNTPEGRKDLRMGSDVEVVGPRIEFQDTQALKRGVTIGYKVAR